MMYASTLFGTRLSALMLCWCSLTAVVVVGQDPTTAPVEDVVTAAPTPEAWEGCVDPGNIDALVTIGEKTTICLAIANNADWSNEVKYMRVNFQPIADDYSRFHVPGSYKQLIVDTGTRVSDIYAGRNITLHASSQTAISFQKRYFDSFGKIFPYLTAVVDVRDGVVQGIAWDDASIFCSNAERERNTFDYAGVAGSEALFNQPVDGCFIEEKECISDYEADKTTCDLLLYVVWTGTDSKGNSFQSSAYRFSSFPAQDLSDRVSQNLPALPFGDN